MEKVVIFSLKGPVKNLATGGSEVYVQNFAEALALQGYDVTILSGYDKGEEDFPKREILADHVEVIRVDVPLGFLPLAIFTIHGYYLKHFHKARPYVIESQQVIPAFTTFYKKQIGTIVYHLTGNDFIRKQGLVKGTIGIVLEKFCFPLFYKNKPLITISTHSLENILNYGFKPEDITIIPPVVDTKSDYILDGKPRENIITYVGRYTGRNGNKKIDHVIEAFPAVLEKVPDAKLIIGGYIKNQVELAKIIEQNGVAESVEFKGQISETQKEQLLRSAKIFASPSYQEGFGITYIEANSYGTPVLGYAIDGLDTVPETAGSMVARDDIAKLSDVMVEWLTNEAKWIEMSHGALANAKRFSKETVINQINNYMEKVTHNG
ncbi:MAG: glycosyltransferase family 4 protein [Lactobacillaceae bacterium]|jgi:glycosyltransferase involved in cell wall biosynthesis|nr:glycosyltransferase family 4 protein [Lactobacillaceae bacterium]